MIQSVLIQIKSVIGLQYVLLRLKMIYLLILYINVPLVYTVSQKVITVPQMVH